MTIFNTNEFIAQYITGRKESLFKQDIEDNHSLLKEQIDSKSVLVIGGAGTIGSSFIRAILKYAPSKLYVIDINENGLTELVRDLRSTIGFNIPKEFVTYPINFGDSVFEKIFRNEGPFDIVANFAAHKHVRSEKDHYSIEAMVENNVIKAKKLLDLLLEFPPKHFFCVSTDKAANPVNVMGASKKLMEDVILAYSTKIPITTARFANVAFSNGSLLFGFIERLMKRQPLSAPSDVKRYFVSPDESGQLCMLACVLGQSGDIFFPKLKEESMTTFSEIAVNFLNVHGLIPQLCQSENEAKEAVLTFTKQSNEYPVYFFESDTSGEKSFEEFYTEGEELDLKRFTELGVIKNTPKKDLTEISLMFHNLQILFDKNKVTKQDIVEILGQYIPNFEHIETGKSLDQKM